MKTRTYATRSGAVRAARNACKKHLAAPFYCAKEGPDYEIHPDSGADGLGYGRYGLDRFYFRLRGPALDAMTDQGTSHD